MGLTIGKEAVHAKNQPRLEGGYIIGEVVVTKIGIAFIAMWSTEGEGLTTTETSLLSYKNMPAKEILGRMITDSSSVAVLDMNLKALVAADPHKKCRHWPVASCSNFEFGFLKGFRFQAPEGRVRFPFSGSLREQTKSVLGV